MINGWPRLAGTEHFQEGGRVTIFISSRGEEFISQPHHSTIVSRIQVRDHRTKLPLQMHDSWQSSAGMADFRFSGHCSNPLVLRLTCAGCAERIGARLYRWSEYEVVPCSPRKTLRYDDGQSGGVFEKQMSVRHGDRAERLFGEDIQCR